MYRAKTYVWVWTAARLTVMIYAVHPEMQDVRIHKWEGVQLCRCAVTPERILNKKKQLGASRHRRRYRDACASTKYQRGATFVRTYIAPDTKYCRSVEATHLQQIDTCTPTVATHMQLLRTCNRIHNRRRGRDKFRPPCSCNWRNGSVSGPLAVGGPEGRLGVRTESWPAPARTCGNALTCSYLKYN